MLRLKLLNAGLLLTSLIGYLEWGQGSSMFLFQAEVEVLSRLYSDPIATAHPLTLLPLLGQILLFVTLFQRRPGKWLTLIGIACLSLLLVLVFVAGIAGARIKVIMSTIPFIVLAIYTVREQLRNDPTSDRR